MKVIDWPLPKQIMLFCGSAFIIAVIVWSIWSLIGAPLPVLIYVQPDWARLLEASTPWKIYNPWVLSRWYDLLFFPVWTLLVVLIVYFTKDKPPLFNFEIANGFMIGAGVILLWPLIFFLGVCSLVFLAQGDLINFYVSIFSTIFSLKGLETMLYLYLFFVMVISLFTTPIYFGLVISLLYGATFGFAAGLAVFILYFAPWYVAYYFIKFLVISIKKVGRKNTKPNTK